MADDKLLGLLEYLANAAREVSRGNYSGAAEIFELTKSGKYPPGITDLAEAFGMMVVMVEAREERLENLVEDLRRKKDMLEEIARALRQANIGVLEVLGSAIAKRDHGTSAHNYRVTLYSLGLAEAIGHAEENVKSLIKGAFLHDVGKIGISDTILLKEGKLTDMEFTIMKSHVNHGSDIVRAYPWLGDCIDVVLHHHEKFDGTGYPTGLKAADIPINARIFAIADVFDALTSVRPYKRALTYDEAMAIMTEGRGSHFDPDIFDRLGAISKALYQLAYSADEEALRESLKVRIAELFDSEG